MTLDEHIELCRMWSGSLPAIFGVPARPWNGRVLTAAECQVARAVYFRDGAQAALEWLGETAR